MFRWPKLDRPLPDLGSVSGWKQAPIEECGEPMVALGPFSKYTKVALQDSIYWGERNTSPYNLMAMKGSLLTPFVRLGVAEALTRAARLLPDRHRFMIWDSYRTLEVQQSLFDGYVAVLESRGTPHEQALVDAQQFVSIPSTDPTRPSPHNTGAVVDLTIVRFSKPDWKDLLEAERYLASKNWEDVYEAEMLRLGLLRHGSEILDMGTPFDATAPQTATAYFEQNPDDNPDALRNRRLLYWTLASAGFRSYEEEWWHFSMGDQFWAKKTGKPAFYGAAPYSDENSAWEQMRQQHFVGNLAMVFPQSFARKATIPTVSDRMWAVVHDAAITYGDPRFSQHPQTVTL